MRWLERTANARLDVRHVLPGAQSVVVLATNYWRGPDNRAPGGPPRGIVARYARGRDYHNLLRKKVSRVAAVLEAAGGTQRCYTDTGPVLERDYAALAGIGWHGKSTMLLNETLGTWFLISVILTTLHLPTDRPLKDRCGRCVRCMTACPTGAIVAPYTLDARRCLSYWTIEHRGSIPTAMRPLMGARIFGCDDCLDACPWNRFARASNQLEFSPKPGLEDVPLRTLLAMPDAALEPLIRGTPLARAGVRGLKRNIAVALGNTGTTNDLPALQNVAHGPDILLSEHADWATREIERRNAAPTAPASF